MTFDDLRAAHPQLGFAVYAYDPLAAGGPVTLEIRTPVGEHFSFPGATLAVCIDLAFPYVPPAPVAPILVKSKEVDIFGMTQCLIRFYGPDSAFVREETLSLDLVPASRSNAILRGVKYQVVGVDYDLDMPHVIIYLRDNVR